MKKEQALELIVKEGLSKEELTKLLYDLYLDESEEIIDLSGLDFTAFHKSVDLSYMLIKGYLYQSNCLVSCDIQQNGNFAGGDYWQTNNHAVGNIAHYKTICGGKYTSDYTQRDKNELNNGLYNLFDVHIKPKTLPSILKIEREYALEIKKLDDKLNEIRKESEK